VAAVPSSVLAAPKAVIASLSDASRSDPTRPIGLASSASVDAHAAVLDQPAPRAHANGARAPEHFARDARMATLAEFDRCLRKPAVFRSGSFALHLEWITAMAQPEHDRADEIETPVWRLGLVIPKRYEASAVARNTIKRRWRDAFRRGRAAWAAEFGSADVVVRLQAPLLPKPAKAAAGRGAPKAPVAPVLPARVRARDRFDPVAMLGGFVDRLRSRGGRPVVAATLVQS